MPSNQTGGCLCEKSRYTFTGEPAFTLKCFCRDCQHATGGGHAPSLAVKAEGVTKSGLLKTYHRKSDEGNDLEFGFCSECGSPVYKTTSKLPEMVFFYAGSLDDPSGFSPEYRPYEERRQPWDGG